MTAAAIGQFEKGDARPSLGTLGKLTLALKVPVQFFAATRPSFAIAEEDSRRVDWRQFAELKVR